MTDRSSTKSAQHTPDDCWVRAAIEQYEATLTVYAARLVRDADLARDIVQDTFLKLWTADRATVDGHLGQWLFRVCRNRALDVRKKEVRMTALTENHVESGRETAGQAQPSSEAKTVQLMLEDLPERQQEVIRLKFQGGLSYKEIANVMDLTVNHVGVLIHTGLKSIREKLQANTANPLAQPHIDSQTSSRFGQVR